jgi:hypothetical protein
MNKRLLLLTSILLSFFTSFAQDLQGANITDKQTNSYVRDASVAPAAKSISFLEVTRHVGEAVTVCGKVYNARLLVNEISKPTLLNVGEDNQPERFAIRIRFESEEEFEYQPEKLFANKNLCFTGTITNDRGFAEIKIDSVNTQKLLREALSIAATNDSSSSKNDIPDGYGDPENKYVKLTHNAYLLAGSNWNETIITHLKAGSTVLVDYKRGDWCYVKVIKTLEHSKDNSWLYGFVNKRALDLATQKKQSKKQPAEKNKGSVGSLPSLSHL